jgi:hypothetical protein
MNSNQVDGMYLTLEQCAYDVDRRAGCLGSKRAMEGNLPA